MRTWGGWQKPPFVSSFVEELITFPSPMPSTAAYRFPLYSTFTSTFLATCSSPRMDFFSPSIYTKSEGLILKGQFPEEQKEYLVVGTEVRISSQAFTEKELSQLGDLKIAAVSPSETGMGLEVSVLLEGSTVLPF